MRLSWYAMIIIAGLGVSSGPSAAEMEKQPRAVIDTSKGTIVIELYADRAPKTVANFVKLAKEGFYNGIVFHRVIRALANAAL